MKNKGSNLNLQLHKEALAARLLIDKLQAHTQRIVSQVNDSDHREALYREAGDLILLIPQLLEELEGHLAAMSYVYGNLDKKRLRQQVSHPRRQELDDAVSESTAKMARRVAHRYRIASSQLPDGSFDYSRPEHPNSEESGYFWNLYNSGGSTPQKKRRREELSPGSIYDVEFADDLAKPQSEGIDHRDWTHLRPEYNRPHVPDHIRFH